MVHTSNVDLPWIRLELEVDDRGKMRNQRGWTQKSITNILRLKEACQQFLTNCYEGRKWCPTTHGVSDAPVHHVCKLWFGTNLKGFKVDLTTFQKSSLKRHRLCCDSWVFCFESQSPKPVEECLAIWKCLVSETLAASMIVRSSRSSSALFFPLVQRLRTFRRIQLLPLLHSTGRKSGCFKLTSVEVTTKTGRMLLIFNFSSSQQKWVP